MKFITEIKKIGLIDWVWFVIYLKRNEFSPKLSLGNIYIKNSNHGFLKKDGTHQKWFAKLIKNRNRAHKIDDILEKI